METGNSPCRSLSRVYLNFFILGYKQFYGDLEMAQYHVNKMLE